MRFLRWVIRRVWQLTDRHHRLSELGAITGRSLLIAGGGGLALLGLTIGACTAIPVGGGTTTTTTTAAPTTTTSTSTSTTTTSTTTVPVTTTTVGGADPCAAENPTTPGFPCTVNAGVHGVTFTAANTTANNGTSCTVCPAGVTWSGGSYQINNCAVIDSWKFNGEVDVVATNGNKSIGLTEAQTITAACVRLTHVLIQPPEPGVRDGKGLWTGFTAFNNACSFNGTATPCGPVYMADSEIAMNHPNAAGTCSGNPCNSGFSYPASDTNLHLWRDYFHGTSQGLDCDGDCEIHDSYMRADRSDQATLNAGGAIGTSGHGDGFFQDGGNAPWMLIDHSTFFCGAQMLDCNVDGAYIGDQSAPSGGVVKNSLFKQTAGAFFCLATGVSEPGKAFPTGQNITIKNNTFELGAGGVPCQHNNAIKTWDPTVAAAHNDHFCNNVMSDGSLAVPSYETGSCP